MFFLFRKDSRSTAYYICCIAYHGRKRATVLASHKNLSGLFKPLKSDRTHPHLIIHHGSVHESSSLPKKSCIRSLKRPNALCLHSLAQRVRRMHLSFIIIISCYCVLSILLFMIKARNSILYRPQSLYYCCLAWSSL